MLDQKTNLRFEIVKRAWIYDSDERPSFADLLPELEALRGNPAYQASILEAF